MGKNKCDKVTIVVCVVVAAILILFVCMTCRVGQHFGWENDTEYSERKDTIVLVNDTSNMNSIGCVDSTMAMKSLAEHKVYNEKVDSLSKVVDNVNGQYISMIDMMIDKFNTWVGFWLAVLSLILLLVSVWQYLKIEKYDERIKEIETKGEALSKSWVEKNKTLTKDFDGQSDKMFESLTDIQMQMRRFQRQAKDYLDSQLSEHKYSTLENRMTSLLLCLSSVPDPQMFSDSDERKEQVTYYLRLISAMLTEYFRLIEKESETHQLHEATIACIPMVLLNLRMSIIRLQGILRDPIVYIKYEALKKNIEKLETSIRRNHMLCESEVTGLKGLMKEFNEFKAEIERSKEIV